MYQYPYGNAQQLNLDWLMEQWQEVKQSIDGSLQGEIDRVEAAITDLLNARDAAVAAASAANTSAGAAASSANTAAGQAAIATAQAAAATQERINAANAANNAQTYAGNAQTQATAAANSAGAAYTSASQAAASASDAHDDALAAAGSASDAHDDAVDAHNDALAAAGSASDAHDDAVAAQNSADAAAASAASLIVDSALSDSSTNPVQNMVITNEILEIQKVLLAERMAVPYCFNKKGKLGTNNARTFEIYNNTFRMKGTGNSTAYRAFPVSGKGLPRNITGNSNATLFSLLTDDDFIEIPQPYNTAASFFIVVSMTSGYSSSANVAGGGQFLLVTKNEDETFSSTTISTGNNPAGIKLNTLFPAALTNGNIAIVYKSYKVDSNTDLTFLIEFRSVFPSVYQPLT